MDTFQNDTSSPISTEPKPENPQPLQSVPTETVQENVASPTPPPVTVTPTKSNKNYLEIGILLVILAILACLVTWYFVSKNQTASVPQEFGTTDQIVAEASPQPTISEVTPTISVRNLRIVADCNLWNINNDGNLDLVTENDLLCDSYATSTVLDESMRFVLGTVETDTESRDTVTIDLDTLKVVDNEKLTYTNYFDKASGLVYTLDSSTIYKGPLDNLQKTKIFQYEEDLMGRGSGPQDEVALIPNNDRTKLLYTNTFSQDIFSDETVSLSPDLYFGGFIILSENGNRLLEVPASFKPRWVNNNTILTFVYGDDMQDVILRKYTIDEQNNFAYVDLIKVTESSNIGTIYNLDILGDTALITAENDNKHSSYTLDLSNETSQLVKLNSQTAMNFLISENLMIGFDVIPCVGDPGEGDLSCPGDGPFDQYVSKISTYNLVTKVQKTILEIEKPTIL